jgi:hypothetical protein
LLNVHNLSKRPAKLGLANKPNRSIEDFNNYYYQQETMQRREFITAAVGAAATVASTSQAFAEGAGGGEKESYEKHHAYACKWTATSTHGIDTVSLTVKGVCQEPTPGYKLTLVRVDLPGSDPSTLTLVLSVVAPTGIEPQHVTPTPVEYQQTFVIPKDHVPTKVTVFEAAATVQINAS